MFINLSRDPCSFVKRVLLLWESNWSMQTLEKAVGGCRALQSSLPQWAVGAQFSPLLPSLHHDNWRQFSKFPWASQKNAHGTVHETRPRLVTNTPWKVTVYTTLLATIPLPAVLILKIIIVIVANSYQKFLCARNCNKVFICSSSY